MDKALFSPKRREYEHLLLAMGVDAFVLAAKTRAKEPGQIFNVGSGTQTAIREIVSIAREELAIDEEPVWNTMDNRVWDTTTWARDSSHMQADLGWTPESDFSTGLSQSGGLVQGEPGNPSIPRKQALFMIGTSLRLTTSTNCREI